MKLLATLRDQDIFPNRPKENIDKWEERKTVKIIALNKDNQIALITNPIHGFFLLPGGGFEKDENLDTAALRECEEEIAYRIKNITPLAQTKEYRSRNKKEYDTFSVFANITNSVDQDKRTDNEKEIGLNVKWFSLKDAIETFIQQEKKLQAGEVDFYNTGFNIIRDKLFVEYYASNYAS